jgi:hypothetical protein
VGLLAALQSDSQPESIREPQVEPGAPGSPLVEPGASLGSERLPRGSEGLLEAGSGARLGRPPSPIFFWLLAAGGAGVAAPKKRKRQSEIWYTIGKTPRLSQATSGSSRLLAADSQTLPATSGSPRS